MRKFYPLLLTLILSLTTGLCAFAQEEGEENQTSSYTGKLSIDLLGSVTEMEDETVSITPTGENTCTFALYDFKFAGEVIGDIVIENVEIGADEDGNTTYAGEKEGLSLGDGAINVDVTCTGVEDAEGNLVMLINVKWMGLPVIVTFEGKLDEAGINSAVNDSENEAIEYYRINGIQANPEALNPGLYITKQGVKTRKLIVR